MRPTAKFLATAVLVALFAATSPEALCQTGRRASTSALAGKVIKRVEVRGNRKVKTREITKVLRIRVGDVLRPETLDRDVTRIWRLGYFEDISVEAEPYEDGVLIIFIVREKPTVRKLTFNGNKEFSDRELQDIIGIKEKGFVDPYLLKLSRQRIIDSYLERGYRFVKVKQTITRKDDEYIVAFDITEGPQVLVRRIGFVGNKSFSARRLRRLMKTKSRRWPLVEGLFNEQDLEEDLLKIKDFYRSNGWLDVVVGRELSYDDRKKNLYITIHIAEGVRYTIENIIIRGNELFTGAEIRRRLLLKEGSPIIQENLEKDVLTIKEMYGAQGYIDREVRVRTPLSEEPGKISVIFDIKEGKRIFVEKIEIRGNIKTRDHVIRREITLNPGDRFDTTKLRETRNRLINTGFFESYDPLRRVPPIRIETEPGSAPDRRNLVINVQEGRTGTLTFGAGISSNVGLIGEISLTQRNFDILDFPKSLDDFLSGNAFVGGGQIFSLVARPGVERSEYLISFREPSAFDSPYGFGTSGFYYQRAREDYDEERAGGTLSIERRIGRNLRVGVTYSGERIDITNIDEDSAPADVLALRGARTRFGLEFRAIYDTRDNVFLPTRGVKIEGILEPVGEWLGGDVDVIRAEISGKYYRQLFEVPKWGKHIISIGARVGVVDSLSDEDVPIFERYFAGGPGDAASLRGFAYRGVGPVDPTVREQIGGEVLMLATLEYGFPIISDAIRGVAFVDVGKVGKMMSDFDFNQMRGAAGVGLRLRVPEMGNIPIALDFGFPFAKEPDDDTQVFSFTIGGGLRF